MLIFLDEIYFADSGYREVDIALMTICNHTIISTGTFSWWSGYLNNGDVTRYGGWPALDSNLEKLVNITDYFLPQWRTIN